MHRMGQTDPVAEMSWRYRGWRIVAALFLVQIAIFGLGFYGQGLYLSELRRLNGWPIGVISTGSTISYVLSSLLAVFVSDLIQWGGPRRLLVAGIGALAASLVLFASADTIIQLYAGFTMLALAWVGLGAVSAAMIVGMWFEQKRGLAISITFTGASVSGVALMPGLTALVESTGFRNALEIVALVMPLVLVPVVASVCFPPQRYRLVNDTAAGAAPLTRTALLRDTGFLYLTGAFALVVMVQVGFLVHQISILEPMLGRQSAAAAVAVTTSMALIGRIGLGIVADRINPRGLAALSMGSQAIALMAMGSSSNITGLYLACGLFGFSVGNLITLPALIIQREYPPASFSVVLGLSMAIAGVINACGPMTMGLVRDLTGGYAAPMFIGVALQLASVCAVLFAPKPIFSRAA